MIFGPGDSFLNRLATLARQSPVLPLFGTGGTRLQPVFVENVAEACVRVLADPSTGCRVYELGGPQVYAYRELVQLVLEGIGRRTVTLPVPFLVWDILAAVTALHPDPPLTRDQVKLMKRDNVVGKQALTLENLGIRPTPVDGGLIRLHRRDPFLIAVERARRFDADRRGNVLIPLDPEGSDDDAEQQSGSVALRTIKSIALHLDLAGAFPLGSAHGSLSLAGPPPRYPPAKRLLPFSVLADHGWLRGWIAAPKLDGPSRIRCPRSSRNPVPRITQSSTVCCEFG